MVKRKAEVDADASRAPARRSSRNKSSDDKVKSETTPAPKSENKTHRTTSKKSSHKDAAKAEVKVGPVSHVVIVRSALDCISTRFCCLHGDESSGKNLTSFPFSPIICDWPRIKSELIGATHLCFALNKNDHSLRM